MGLGGAAAVGLGAAFWKDLFTAAEGGHLRTGPGYGPRRPPGEHGIRLPEGFRARAVARGGQRVPGTDYVWHEASDGAATFRTRGGGWILVSNSEADPGARAPSGSGRTAGSRTRTASSRALRRTAPEGPPPGARGSRARKWHTVRCGSATPPAAAKGWRTLRWASSSTRQPRSIRFTVVST
jgi:hypothetical protein